LGGFDAGGFEAAGIDDGGFGRRVSAGSRKSHGSGAQNLDDGGFGRGMSAGSGGGGGLDVGGFGADNDDGGFGRRVSAGSRKSHGSGAQNLDDGGFGRGMSAGSGGGGLDAGGLGAGPQAMPAAPGFQNDGSAEYWCAVANTPYGRIPGKAQDGRCWYSFGGKEECTEDFQIIHAYGFAPGPSGPPHGEQHDSGGYWCAVADTPHGKIPGKAQGGSCWYPLYGEEHLVEGGFQYIVSTPMEARTPGFQNDGAAKDPPRSTVPARAVVAADREVLQTLQREVSELGERLSREQDLGRQLQHEVQESIEHGARLTEEEGQLAAALQEAKAKLRRVREEHRSTNLEFLSLYSDCGHVAEELSFLNRRAEDDRRTMEVLTQANKLLQRHNEDLEAQRSTLEGERKALSFESAQERELAKKEERELAALKHQAERLNRVKMASHYEQEEAKVRDQRLQEIKKGSIVTASPVGSPQRSAQGSPHGGGGGGGHSWAQHVSTATSPYLGSSPSASQKVLGGPPSMRAPGADVHF